ncbi:MAG: 4Fe-4S binding protein [Candidatus Omnitrophica bacterium]|nr:4Fe-4S binding protein [Candidatus Omnitrophota bacterium]
MINTGGALKAIGAVFVTMCLITTVLAIFLGLATRHRAWCAICPMGTLQDHLHKIKPRRAHDDK